MSKDVPNGRVLHIRQNGFRRIWFMKNIKSNNKHFAAIRKYLGCESKYITLEKTVKNLIYCNPVSWTGNYVFTALVIKRTLA